MPKRWRRVANAQFLFGAGLGRRLQDRLGGRDDRAEALGGLLGQPHAHGAAAGLEDRLGHALAQRLGAARVEVDRRDRHLVAPEVDGARAGAAELDARVLEADQVVERGRAPARSGPRSSSRSMISWATSRAPATRRWISILAAS